LTIRRTDRDFLEKVVARLEKLDPQAQRRIRGLRFVTAYALASMMGTMADIARGMPDRAAFPALAGGFALWASVSEGRATRFESSRDLTLLSASAALGAISYVLLAAPLTELGPWGSEMTLVSGAFLVSYLRRFGLTGAGVGSQIYIGQLLAYTAHLSVSDWPTIVGAGLVAALAAVIPRILSGPVEQPAPTATGTAFVGAIEPELAMGLQAATAALVVVLANAAIGLTESAWAITASTYVIAGPVAGTRQRVWRRIVGTVFGVSLGLCCLPLTEMAPLVIWALAALAMMIYAMAVPERYDVACGAYAFVLVVTLAISGVHSLPLLASRAWETVLGGALGMVAATLLLPIRVPRPT
jgi:Fusaric acid resistance protein-like